MWILLFMLLPVEAQKPIVEDDAHYFVKVDRIIVNHYRYRTQEFDEWGRPHFEYHEECWVSFWELKVIQIPLGPPIFIWSDRGYESMYNVASVAPCTDGWCVETKERINVIARDLLIIDSPYDWELKNREWFDPIVKPEKGQ